MKRFYLILLILILLGLNANFHIVFGQGTFELRNKIDLTVQAVVNLSGQNLLYGYKYTLHSLPTSEQNLWRFLLISKDTTSVVGLTNPQGWFKVIPHIDKSELELTIDWGSPSAKGTKPGETERDLSFSSKSLPGICTYYAEGYAPPPSFEPGMAPDSIPGYEDLTPYGPGIVGQTIGPVLPPDPFVTVDFVDTLASYKHQAFTLGWINNQGIVNSLDAKLDNAKKHLEKGKITPAINVLQAFINEVEAQNGKKLTNEAYALLKFNAEFLIDQLSQP